MKVCRDCRQNKPNAEFYKHTKNKDRLTSYCKICFSNRQANYKQRKPEDAKSKQRRYQLKRFYGITQEQYDDLLRQQNGCCAVCGRPAESFSKRLAVDHDHATGEIRGIVCDYDNRFVIGRLRKGNGGDQLLRNAGEYLARENYTGFFVPKKKPKKRKKRGKNPSNRTR